jgi:ketosteroid isomerase-like protein
MPSKIESHVTEFRTADREAQQRVVDKDVRGLRELLEEDATNYGPNAPPASGRNAFAQSFEEAFELQGFAVGYPRPSKVVAAASGELGYTVAEEEITVTGADGGRLTVQSHCLAVWRRQPDGSWKIAENMWNFAQPFPPQT